MIILFSILGLICAAAIVFGGYMMTRHLLEKSVPPARIQNETKLSWPAKQIVKMYNSLPSENRPNFDVVEIVRALDVKYGRVAMNQHFISYYYSSSPSWNCEPHQYQKSCKYKEYDNLYTTLLGISDDLKAQQHALEVAAVEGSLAEVQLLMEQAQQEREIIQSVTKQLVNNKE